MNLLKKFKDKTTYFIKTRRTGFYFLIAALILSLTQIIIYNVAFSANDFIQYKHYSVILLAVFAIILGLGLSLFKWTESIAPFVTFFLEVFSFMMFFKYGYMYFSELFFAGVTWQRITEMYYGYMASIILYILIFITSIVSFFSKQSKKIVEI